MTREARHSEDSEVRGVVEDLRERGLDYGGWTTRVVEGVVRGRAAAEGLPGVAALRPRLLDDRECLLRLVLELSARPNGMFSEPGMVRTLRGDVSPRLRTYPTVRVWHAGCSTGEDVWTTAVVLYEEGLLGRTRIYATEQSDLLIERARKGRVQADAHAADRYRDGGGGSSLAEYLQPAPVGDSEAQIRPQLAERVLFSEHDFASDASFNEFHLIVCRGLLPRFGRALRERALGIIEDSLCRFGYLLLGEGEKLDETTLEPVTWGQGLIYRKVR